MFPALVSPTPIYLSGNWAGPVVTTARRTLSQASGTFRVPTAPIEGPNGAEMAYWIGLGGYGQPMNLCQAGVADTRSGGHLVAGLIAQDYPAPPVVKSGIVHPGDRIRATVGHVGSRYVATVMDLTTHQSLTIGCRVPPQGAWQHAEWIAESKLNQDGQPVLISNPVQFSHLATQQTASGPHWWQLYMGPATWPTLRPDGTATIAFW